ncbi:Class II abasic (AP) endonuclease [Monascus purpureus]|uniref:DNA-(apurinic or apyrimidinic site) endonuclease 2 n=1 Tax=Monascus purpureus TaxID=5098 RepID=A0A507QKY5_MONPU|nr:Class II abasic (AP) endonuclease [Monascus purpureus]
MGFRVTTWNVNGIRNPFSYEPWRGNRTFESMFDILEADIVVFQETKIQRKDLRDDMVLVPGWDCYFSLPRVKKGYSGVVIYTRNATCAPIRAEEGLTGVLCPPNSSVSFRDLPEEQQIGGYPTLEQLSGLELDTATLDSEGRSVILEFPAFVLLGVYCPANRDESRDCFRLSFLDVLDFRIRNLLSMGKRVFVTGDLNISRGEIDSAHAAETIRKGTVTEDEFVSAPARRLFNQLLTDGKVIGERDEARGQPVLHDICRSFHPSRRGMYTCWEQRINARPGNYGSRIDYVLCSLVMKDWFSDSNIQEGLMGSDHCPVYAVFNDWVTLNGDSVNIRDIMNPPGMFEKGERKREYTMKDLLPLSGRLIPEFDRRRSIKDMFSRRPAGSSQKSLLVVGSSSTPDAGPHTAVNGAASNKPLPSSYRNKTTADNTRKRPQPSDSRPSTAPKRSKSATKATAVTSLAGQRTLKGFFRTNNNTVGSADRDDNESPTKTADQRMAEATGLATSSCSGSKDGDTSTRQPNATDDQAFVLFTEGKPVIDRVASREDWSKLFSKKPTPKCEGHQEPCISLTTKKPGINCGRSFWICPRPLGPSGNKEKGTQWRCSTFIWASDWNSSS